MAADDGRIRFTPSDQVKLYLKELQRMGIYGKGRSAVINAILGEKILALLKDGILERLPRELEPEPSEDDED